MLGKYFRKIKNILGKFPMRGLRATGMQDISTSSNFDTPYRAASLKRRASKNWLPTKSSVNLDYSSSAQDLIIARCRDAYRNQALAKAAVDRLKHNVSGYHGIKLQSKLDWEYLQISQQEGNRIGQQAERYFNQWASYCDYEEDVDFYEMQTLLLVSLLISGDVFVNTLIQEDEQTPVNLKLQVIEGDRCSNPGWAVDQIGLRRGIELTTANVPVAYYFLTQHPFDDVVQQWRWVRVPAKGVSSPLRRVLHIKDKERPGQFRGIPYLTSVLEPLKQLSDYTDNELTAAVVSSLFTVFIKTKAGSTLPNYTTSTTEPANDDEISLGNGSIINLLPDESIDVADPKRPNAQFDLFVNAIMKEIAAALSLPLDMLTLQFNSSYSAARAALLQMWKLVLYYRSLMARRFCQPVYNLFWECLINQGIIKIRYDWNDPMVKYAYTKASWIGSARGAIDENKEVSAAKDRIDLGISTIEAEAEELKGEDWLDIHKQRKLENDMRKADGLQQSSISPTVSNAPSMPSVLSTATPTAPQLDQEKEA